MGKNYDYLSHEFESTLAFYIVYDTKKFKPVFIFSSIVVDKEIQNG